MRFLYSISISFYGLGILIFSLFNKKAKQWVNGRRNLLDTIKKTLENEKKEVVWFHAASLGEFEQGRTVIEEFRVKYPNYKIILTFFSPSGYEIRKNYQHAHYIFYLPLDTPKNAKRFIQIVNPKMVFFIKYEFWFNYLYQLKKREIPTYIISAIFRPSQHFFKTYGSWFRKQLTVFSCFFVQNQISQDLLKSVGFNNVVITGDTRFDRVLNIAKTVKPIPFIDEFKQNLPVLLVGSSWAEDEKILQECFYKSSQKYKIIFAPHEITNSHISSLKMLFKEECICYSEINSKTNVSIYKVLIIDSIGMLSSLYSYATIAFIGGGFGKGIHNILEAAVFGLPVFFGPNYQKFQEAKDLLEQKGAYVINNSTQLNTLLIPLLTDEFHYQIISCICENYVREKSGATNLIMNTLNHNFAQDNK